MVVRDLQWRRRRFVLAGLATSLVFSLTLLLTGVSTAVHAESDRVVRRFDADVWLVREGGGGPFTNGASLLASTAEEVAAIDGIDRAEPVLLVRGALAGTPPKDINIVGIQVGGLGEPEPDHGSRLAGPGEAVVDAGLGFDPGDTFTLAGHELKVAGTADRLSYFFGIPSVFMTNEDVQRIVLGGAPAASAVVAQGALTAAPDGLAMMDEEAVIADLERPLARGTESIDLIRVLLTLTAAGIVGLIVYLSTLERTADLAVLKATGSSKGFMASGLAIQAVVLSVASALVATALAALIAPMFPVPLEVHARQYAELFVLAVLVGLVASLAGVWKSIRVDPAMAFGGR